MRLDIYGRWKMEMYMQVYMIERPMSGSDLLGFAGRS